jgi:hypothetical protein
MPRRFRIIRYVWRAQGHRGGAVSGLVWTRTSSTSPPNLVYVGRSQTSERQFPLGKYLRATLAFFDPAVADPTSRSLQTAFAAPNTFQSEAERLQKGVFQFYFFRHLVDEPQE